MLVGLDGDRLDAVRPAFERVFVKVARSVVGVDAGCVENLRAQVVAQTGKAALVEHQRGAFLAVDALGFQVREQVLCRDVFIQNVGSKPGEEGVGVFLWCRHEDDVGGGPQPNSVLVGQKFGSK